VPTVVVVVAAIIATVRGRRTTAVRGVARRHPIAVFAAAAVAVSPRWVIAGASTTTATPAALVGTLAGNVLHRQHGLVELAAVGGVLGTGGLLDGPELHKGVVSLHVDPAHLPERLEQHLQVGPSGRLLVEVDNEERVGRLDVPAALVLLALDPAVPPRELGAEGGGDVLDPPGKG
jgi:hypothetical protein